MLSGVLGTHAEASGASEVHVSGEVWRRRNRARHGCWRGPDEASIESSRARSRRMIERLADGQLKRKTIAMSSERRRSGDVNMRSPGVGNEVRDHQCQISVSNIQSIPRQQARRGADFPQHFAAETKQRGRPDPVCVDITPVASTRATRLHSGRKLCLRKCRPEILRPCVANCVVEFARQKLNTTVRYFRFAAAAIAVARIRRW